MARFFNTTGPCDPQQHYMVPAQRRLPDLMPYIERQQYFVLHAARQTGKTTAMMALARDLTERGYAAVWATLEVSQGLDDLERAEPAWLRALAREGGRLPAPLRPPDPQRFIDREPANRLQDYLSAWAADLDRPLVLLLDEADVMSGPALVGFLRQLRAGFMTRGVGRFPTSVGLIGMRDLRDYLTQSKDGDAVNPGSPFNIKAESFTLRNFSAAEVDELLGQHHAATGQVIEPAASAQIFALTQGQPYLVNWLADRCVFRLVPDPTAPVTREVVDEAAKALILARTTHLDALAERLKEPRVARVIAPVLLGDVPQAVPYETDDFRYVVDLGLVVAGPGGAEAANPLYREVLVRELSLRTQSRLAEPWWRWATPTGRLDFPALVEAFQAWWRENADAVREHGGEYREAVPHLTLMAFLQRVVNGGGRIHREFSAGRGRVDLLVEYAGDRFVVEVKRVRSKDAPDRVRDQGITQLSEYLDTVGETEGWLFLFDTRDGPTWDQRLWTDTVHHHGKTVHLVGV